MSGINVAQEYVLLSIVDAMQIPIFPFTGGYTGTAKKVVKIGPWTLQLEPLAFSDALKGEEASFFKHVSKDLWVYYVGTKDKDFPVSAHIINGSVAKMEPPKATSLIRYGTGDVQKTLEAFKPAIVASYVFSADTQTWKATN